MFNLREDRGDNYGRGWACAWFWAKRGQINKLFATMSSSGTAWKSMVAMAYPRVGLATMGACESASAGEAFHHRNHDAFSRLDDAVAQRCYDVCLTPYNDLARQLGSRAMPLPSASLPIQERLWLLLGSLPPMLNAVLGF